MKITNNRNLPDFFIDALKSQHHRQDGEFSVTEILNSPTMLVLKKRHKDFISIDASALVKSLIGTAVHSLLEKVYKDNPDYIVEEHNVIDVDGIKVSGTFDLFDKKNNVITDYKTTSSYKIKKGEFDEWEKQLNTYAYMLYKNKGIVVEKLQVGAIITDWSETKAEKDEEYPQAPVIMIDIPLWNMDNVEKYLKEVVGNILYSETLSDEELPGCEDKWEKPVVYKVIKKGATRGKNFDTLKEAEEYRKGREEYEIIKEGGEWLRCDRYCAVKDFCQVYQKHLKGGIDGEK